MIILTAEMSSWDNFLQLLGVGILFLFVLAITYFTTRFVGGVKSGITKNSNFKVLETCKIAQNKYLQLVQAGTRYFVIAIGKDDIRFITELNEDEVIKQEQLKAQKDNFSDIFNLVIHKQKDKNKKNDQETDHR